MNGPRGKTLVFHQWAIFVILLASSWVALQCEPSFSILTVPAILVTGVFLAVHWRNYGPLILLLFDPIGVAFSRGAADWFGNKPQMAHMGLPAPDRFNLDSKTRCYDSAGGCVIRGGEWAYQGSHNLGLRIMVAVFGRPPKTYDGPYPTKEKVLELTKDLPPTQVADFSNGTIVANEKRISLGKEVAHKISADLGAFAIDDVDPHVESNVRATVIESRCLIVRVQCRVRMFDDDSDRSERENHDGAFLFDIRTMKPFARFIFHGDAPRIPGAMFSN